MCPPRNPPIPVTSTVSADASFDPDRMEPSFGQLDAGFGSGLDNWTIIVQLFLTYWTRNVTLSWMNQNDQKSEGILDAALPVFVRHGFRKTSMADIARAAGISRAAL